MANPTDRLATVRAALDLMLRVWPGSLDVRGYVDETGNDAAAVIDVATGETIATCDNEDRDDHATPVEDARAIVALRNAAPAIAALADECERLRAENARQREHIRAGGDAVRSANASTMEIGTRLDAAGERIAALEAELRSALDAGAAEHLATNANPEHPPLRYVAIWLCIPCIKGEGRECHTPGCALFLHRVDLPIHEELLADIDPSQATRIATLEAELAQARAHRCGGIVLSAEDADRIAALLEGPPGPTPAMVALFDKAKE